MENKFGLPYLEAISKALKVVKRDAQHFQVDDNVFPIQAQVEGLLEFYLTMDPDANFKNLTKLEPNYAVLKAEAYFLIKIFFVQTRGSENIQSRVPFIDFLRFEHLMNKYKLKIFETPSFGSSNITPMTLSFPDEEYKLQLENPSFCRRIPDSMKKYINFKREFLTESIFGLLPTGKKYGGFIKAFLHLQLQRACDANPNVLFFGTRCLQREISKLRSIYNSSIFPNDERIQWFANLSIKAEDCALWSRLFDQQYPAFKQIYKLFGQIA